MIVLDTMKRRPTFFDPARRDEILARIQRLSPDATARWGRMNVAQMVAHLTDQMRHALGDSVCRPVPSLLGLAPLRHAAIYWVPWPRGRIKGPPDAFVTQPKSWPDDLAALRSLVERFCARDPRDAWPRHALMGAMSGRDWGHFCYKHFNHHLTQFGV